MENNENFSSENLWGNLIRINIQYVFFYIWATTTPKLSWETRMQWSMWKEKSTTADTPVTCWSVSVNPHQTSSHMQRAAAADALGCSGASVRAETCSWWERWQVSDSCPHKHGHRWRVATVTHLWCLMTPLDTRDTGKDATCQDTYVQLDTRTDTDRPTHTHTHLVELSFLQLCSLIVVHV